VRSIEFVRCRHQFLNRYFRNRRARHGWQWFAGKTAADRRQRERYRDKSSRSHGYRARMGLRCPLRTRWPLLSWAGGWGATSFSNPFARR